MCCGVYLLLSFDPPPGNQPPLLVLISAFLYRSQVNTSLQNINLYYNSIGAEGAASLAEALTVQ